MRPRFGPAIAAGDASIDGRAKRWTHQVGVTGSRLDKYTPTSNAIELSSPDAPGDRLIVAS
jgi:hypothetical protein